MLLFSRPGVVEICQVTLAGTPVMASGASRVHKTMPVGWGSPEATLWGNTLDVAMLRCPLKSETLEPSGMISDAPPDKPCRTPARPAPNPMPVLRKLLRFIRRSFEGFAQKVGV